MSHILSALVTLVAMNTAPQVSQQPFSVTFSGADVTMALKAISIRTGANIIVSGQSKNTVTLNMTVSSVDEAVRAVSSAAGIIYRKIGTTYVVAPEESMKKALEPYARRMSMDVRAKDPETLVSKLKEALPYATISIVAGKINVLGIPEDQTTAQMVAEDYLQTEADSMEVSEAVLLTYAKGGEIARVLTGLYPKLKVSAAEGTGPGALGIVGPAATVRAAKDLIQQLDARSDNRDASIVYEVYDLKYASGPAIVSFINGAQKDQGVFEGVQAFIAPESYSPKRPRFNPLTAQLGTTVNSINGGGGSGGATANTQNQNNNQGDILSQVLPGERAKSVVLKGQKSLVEQAAKLIAKLDIKPQQVIIEVHVIETTPEASSKTGIDYKWAPFDFHELPAGTIIADNPAGGPFTNNIETKPVGIGQFSRTPWNFRSILQGMVTNQTARILARPSLQVIDNDQASFFIGNTIRARIITQGALGAQNVAIQEFPVGIILLVAPRVNADGNITLHVNPVVSTVTSVDADNVPQTAAREAETTAIVKDGETVVIGGLIRDDELKTLSEIPILSKIPILGELFKSRTTSRKKTDLIISITPHIVKDVGPGAGK